MNNAWIRSWVRRTYRVAEMSIDNFPRHSKGMFNSGRLLSASLPIKRIRMHISQNFLLLAPVNERQMKNGADFSLFKQGTG